MCGIKEYEFAGSEEHVIVGGGAEEPLNQLISGGA